MRTKDVRIAPTLDALDMYVSICTDVRGTSIPSSTEGTAKSAMFTATMILLV
jgi:hypothetical protein